MCHKKCILVTAVAVSTVADEQGVLRFEDVTGPKLCVAFGDLNGPLAGFVLVRILPEEAHCMGDGSGPDDSNATEKRQKPNGPRLIVMDGGIE